MSNSAAIQVGSSQTPTVDYDVRRIDTSAAVVTIDVSASGILDQQTYKFIRDGANALNLTTTAAMLFRYESNTSTGPITLNTNGEAVEISREGNLLVVSRDLVGPGGINGTPDGTTLKGSGTSGDPYRLGVDNSNIWSGAQVNKQAALSNVAAWTPTTGTAATAGPDAILTLTANVANFTIVSGATSPIGMVHEVTVVQDAVGGRTFGLDSAVVNKTGVAFAINTAANAMTLLQFRRMPGNLLWLTGLVS